MPPHDVFIEKLRAEHSLINQ